MPSSDANVVGAVERFEAIGEDVTAGRGAIIANHNWSADADAGPASSHPLAAAKENRE